MSDVLKPKLMTLIVILGMILINSCKDEKVSDPIQNKPETPPVASLQMDFGSFPTSSFLAKNNNTNEVMTKNNWEWAFFNGVVWQTLVTTGMIVPVTAFAESFNHEAIQQEDGTWLWTYNFTPPGGVKHTASLNADVNNSGVVWKMYISKEGQFENFLWFSGQSNIFATEGTWTINNEPNNPVPWIGIEWQRNLEDSTGSIKYTNIIPEDQENGGYIYYGLTSDLDYNAFYEIYNKGKENTTSIKWNQKLHNGRVKDLLHFGNENWQCWDINLDDIDCEF